MPPRADVPLSTPKAHATDLGWGPYLRTGSRRAPCVPRNRDHEEKPAAARQKLPKGENTHLDIHVCIYICTWWVSKSWFCYRWTTSQLLVKVVNGAAPASFESHMLFFHTFERKFTAAITFPVQYGSGLCNTPYGKWHVSRTERVLVQAKYLERNAYIHPNLNVLPVNFAKERPPWCVSIPERYTWILVILQPWTRITTLRRSCFTERRAPSKAWIGGNIKVVANVDKGQR